MTEKEKLIRRLARKWRRAEKARQEAMEAAQRRINDKHDAYMEALAAGITHNELHYEIKAQEEEAKL